MESIYLFDEYKSYLNAQVRDNIRTRGYRGKLAKAANCQPSYLSRVIGGNLQLTPEHALGMTAFWGLSETESDYFLNLVHLSRSGTPALRRHYGQKVRAAQESHRNLKNRLDLPQIKTGEAEMFYYSAWYISALHVLVSIPNFQTTQSIGQALHLPLNTVEECLSKLKSLGLVEREGERWRVGPSQTHISKDSLFSKMHQMNWRIQAMGELQNHERDSFHYTGLHSLSREDTLRVKEFLAELVANTTRIVRDSPAETLMCLNLDCFTVDR